VRLPLEIKRKVRGLEERCHFKANELLCQKKITEKDINDSENIILDFMIEFEKLYGKKFMNSNLHGHLHLPRQHKKYFSWYSHNVRELALKTENSDKRIFFFPIENKDS
ncbi:hypothetical protein BpHYR1_049117, partial [Brachionus plicatilis]